MIFSAVMASLTLLGSAMAADSGQAPTECDPGIENCIICRVKAFSAGFSLSRDAFVDIGAKIAAYICSGDTSVSVAIEARDAAYALAEAVAVTSVECVGNGQVEGSGTAIARAQANATATAGALAEGFLSVETCNGCHAAIEIFAQSTETAFVEAIAESSSEIIEFVPLRLRESGALIGDFVVAFAEALLPVYAGIIADVRVAAIPGEETCSVTLVGCTQAGDQGACCVVTVDQAKLEIGENAYVELDALLELSDEACKEDSDVSVKAFAAAVASGRAFALSLTKIFGFCASTTLSDACTWASGSIEAVAEAEAVALATATAEVATCDCSIDVTALAASYQSVLVSAITAVQVDACVHGQGVAAFDAIALAVEEASVDALAAIFIEVFSDCSAVTCAGAETAVNGDTSSAVCCVVATPHVETYAASALAAAIAEASVTACTPAGEGAVLVARATASATALAEVAALAIAAFDVECAATDSYSYACGGGDVAIRATASATAKAYAEGWAQSTDCGTCSVEVSTTNELVEEIFVDAVASVWGEACTSGADSFDVDFYKEKFASDHLEVTANAIATAAWYQDNGTCAVVSVACVEDNPNAVDSTETCCTGVLASFPDNPEADNAFAAAEAEAYASGYLCSPAEASSDVTVFVEAVATAWAKVVTFVNADCTAPENGKACFWAESSISSSAEAFATAIADAWAGALGGCGCEAEADDLAHTTSTVIASVTLEVLRDLCVENGETYTENGLITAIVEDHVTAFANAFASAKVAFNHEGDQICTAIAGANAPAGAAVGDDESIEI